MVVARVALMGLTLTCLVLEPSVVLESISPAQLYQLIDVLAVTVSQRSLIAHTSTCPGLVSKTKGEMITFSYDCRAT